MIWTQKYLFLPYLAEQAVVRGKYCLFETRKVAGSATYKQGKIVLNRVVL